MYRLLLILIAMLVIGQANAETLVGTVPSAPPSAPARPAAVAYTAIEAVNIYHIIPPYPPADTLGGAADVAATTRWLAKPGSVEFQEATDDAAAFDSASLLNFMTAGISDSFNADNAPATLHLLDRLRASLDPVVANAKQYFDRPRPFRALKLPVTCDANFAPNAGSDVGMHDSYPSGHATRGWIAALTLVAIDPAHAADWLSRGREFGDSRIACGVHYPSDVDAGRLLAQAAFDSLQADEAFKIDLAAAQLEYKRLDNRDRNGSN